MKSKSYFITVSDFRKVHPNVATSDSDTYFASLVNKILRALIQEHLLAKQFDPVFFKLFTIRSVAYFEDVISHFGLFNGFRKIHLKMFGKKLPFYTVGKEYLDEEINLVDIQFIVWATIQEFINETEGDRFINPETPVIEMISQIIFDILDEEYETAPENEIIYHLLHTSPSDDFYHFRIILHWLHFHSYLSMNYPFISLKDDEKIIREKSKQKIPITINQYMYIIESNKVITEVCSPLAIKAIDWFREITTDPQCLKTIEKVDFRPFSSYIIIGSNSDIIHISPCGNKDEILELSRGSFNASDKNNTKEYDYGNDTVYTALVYFNGIWYVNGIASFAKISDGMMEEENDDLEKEKKNQESLKYFYHAVLKYNKNQPIAFFETFDEWKTFCLNIFPDTPDTDFSKQHPLKNERNLVLFSSEKTGTFTLPDIAMMIKFPGNNLYDKEIASTYGLAFLTGLYSTSLDFLEYIINNNYIPDVAVNSLKGKEYGRKLLQDNKWFLVRFFQPSLFNRESTKALPPDYHKTV